jgi:hypothetical protein
MAEVKFSVPSHDLSKEQRAIVFEVKDNDGSKLGKLWISHGAVRWYPKGTSKRPHKANWSNFAQKMEELPREK